MGSILVLCDIYLININYTICGEKLPCINTTYCVAVLKVSNIARCLYVTKGNFLTIPLAHPLQ